MSLNFKLFVKILYLTIEIRIKINMINDGINYFTNPCIIYDGYDIIQTAFKFQLEVVQYPIECPLC